MQLLCMSKIKLVSNTHFTHLVNQFSECTCHFGILGKQHVYHLHWNTISVGQHADQHSSC